MTENGISADELPDTWRVDVTKAYIGLDLKRGWVAQLLVKDDGTGRWGRMGMQVISEASPTQAARDLLSALEAGLLVR